MKVEIWSDVMCPFCYIGKRKFEHALQQFENNDNVEIVWKSFQLDPGMKTQADKNTHQYLAERKGWTLEYAKQVSSQVSTMAKDVGLDYDFDKAVVANSFNAHRVSHLAKKYTLGDAMEEALFKAYFTEGKNIDDKQTLIQLGTGIGLKAIEVEEVLNSDLYAAEVEQDIMEAQQVGVRGVPFFVIDRKYAVSGAQPSDVFLAALHKAWDETAPQTGNAASDAASCDINGNCN
jgi:predicted DsbA family dithiol-disulfide isomerase